MIGGAFLILAIAAIAVICLWSDFYDDYPDSASRPPPLALRDLNKPKKKVRKRRRWRLPRDNRWRPEPEEIEDFAEIQAEALRKKEAQERGSPKGVPVFQPPAPGGGEFFESDRAAIARTVFASSDGPESPGSSE